MKHAALHGAKRHVDAVGAFDRMLSKLEESPNEHIRGESHFLSISLAIIC